MADGTFALKVSATRADNSATNPIFLQLTDGTAAIDAFQGEGAVAATDGLMVLTDDGTNTHFLQSNVGGDLKITLDGETVTTTLSALLADDSAFTIATDTVMPMGALADDTAPDSVDEGDIGVPRMTLDRKLLMRLVGSTDANRLEIDASGRALIDLNAVNGAAISETNPLYVKEVKEVASGNEIHDYDTTAAVAGDGTDNHQYTAVGTFFLKEVKFAASGSIKAEIQTGALAGPTTKAVAFADGKSGASGSVVFDPPIEVAAADIVRVIRTNREGSAQDVYSTIIGYDV